MKTHLLLLALAVVLPAATNSFAQNADNPNPYAIFGRAPYIAGEKDADAESEKVFVIENFTANSPVARIEHTPRTGKVRVLDKHGKILKEKRLRADENGWLTQDRYAEKYYSISPYAFCAGNPINNIDINGDSLMIQDIASLLSIINGIAPGQNVTFRMNNGVLDPSSFENVAKDTKDTFIQDLYEIASNPTMVELSTVDSYNYLDANGATGTMEFDAAPFDANTKDFGPQFEADLVKAGDPLGRHISGNLGRTLVPVPSASRSTNNNIQIRINAKGKINHRTVGIAHEFGHALLYMRGLPYQHNQQGVDPYVYHRAGVMSKRLGYDY